MLGRLALKLKELAEAELQYECHKNGNSTLTQDLMKCRDNLEKEIVKIIIDVGAKIEKVTGQQATLSLIYSNSNSVKETIDELKQQGK